MIRKNVLFGMMMVVVFTCFVFITPCFADGSDELKDEEWENWEVSDCSSDEPEPKEECTIPESELEPNWVDFPENSEKYPKDFHSLETRDDCGNEKKLNKTKIDKKIKQKAKNKRKSKPKFNSAKTGNKKNATRSNKYNDLFKKFIIFLLLIK